MKEFIINVEGAVYREDRWLLIRRSTKEEHAGGELALVGGTVDQEGFSSDLLERSLQREMFEEVGIEISDSMTYIRNTSFVTAAGEHVVDIVFLCEIKHGEPYAKSEDEVDEVLWMTTDEILQSVETADYLKESIIAADRMRKEVGVS